MHIYMPSAIQAATFQQLHQGSDGSGPFFFPQGGEILEMSLASRTGSGEEDEEGAMLGVSVEDELYLVLEGRQQTHVVTMKHSHDYVWLAPIPGTDKLGFISPSLLLSFFFCSVLQNDAFTLTFL